MIYLAEVPSQQRAMGVFWFQKGKQQIHQLTRKQQITRQFSHLSFKT